MKVCPLQSDSQDMFFQSENKGLTPSFRDNKGLTPMVKERRLGSFDQGASVTILLESNNLAH